MRKRVFAALLSLCMLLSLLPSAALAQTGNQGNADSNICAGLENCIDGSHDIECPMYVPAINGQASDEPGKSQAANYIQDRILALPDLNALNEMDEYELDAVYDEILSIYDAIDGLSGGADSLDLTKLEATAEFFADRMALLEGEEDTGSMDAYGSNTVFNDISLSEADSRLLGDGTESSPYKICTAEDFYLINYVEYWHEYLGLEPAHYRQMNDIDLSEFDGFDGTTYIAADFGGVYDGDGYAFKNAQKPLFLWVTGDYIGDSDMSGFINYQVGDYTELFTAQITNVTISEPYINEDVWGSRCALALNARYAAFYNCNVLGGEISSVETVTGLILNGYSVVLDSCSVKDVKLNARKAVGGLANYFNSTTDSSTAHSIIINCETSGSFQTGSGYSGGIVASLDDVPTLTTSPLRVVDCVSSADILLTNEFGASYVGGIVGMCWAWASLENCQFNGSISLSETAENSNYIGGIVSYLNTDSSNGERAFLLDDDCSAQEAQLPSSDPENKLYVGRIAGYLSSLDYTPTGDPDDYGYISGLNLKGYKGELNISGNFTLYADEDCEITSITVDGSITVGANFGKIGNIKSKSGSITIASNTGTIGDLDAALNVTIGSSQKTADATSVYGYPTISYGNASAESVIGDINSGGYTYIYRNLGTIGNITSGSYTAIGQDGAAYKDYQINSGTIGSVNAATGFSIYNNTETGKIATDDGQSVTVGAGNIIVGSATAANRGTIGDIVSKSTGTNTISVFSNGIIGDITKEYAAGDLSIVSNNGTIGAIKNASNVYVGSSNKSASNAGSVPYGNNENGFIESIDSGISVTVYRNLGTIGDIKAATSVTTGQDNATYKDYQINSGTIGSIDAGTYVYIYNNTETGKIATEDGQAVTAGAGNIAVGNTVAANRGEIGDIISTGTSTETVTVFSNGTIASITKENSAGDLSITSNNGTIGAIKNAGTVYIGSANKTPSNAGSIPYGNNADGFIESIDSGKNVIVYRNLGIIGDITAATSVTIGQDGATYNNYQINSGTIGSINAGTTALMYSNTETGKIATEEGQSVTAGTGNITAGSTNSPNLGQIGPLKTTSAGTSAIYVRSLGNGTVGDINHVGTGGVSIGSKDNPQSVPMGTVTAPGSTVSGYSNVPITINALKNSVVFNIGGTYTSTTGKITVYIKDGATVIKNTATGEDLYTYPEGDKTLLLNATTYITVEEGVTLNTIRALTNGHLYISQNSGVIESVEHYHTANMEVTQNTGTIGTIMHAGAGSLTVKANTGTIEKVVQKGTGATSITTSAPIAYVENATGILTLSGTLGSYDRLYENVTTTGNLVISQSIGKNDNNENSVINVKLKDAVNSTVSGGANYTYYLKFSEDSTVSGNLTITSSTAKNGTAYRNTMDFEGVSLDGVTVIKSTGDGTEVKPVSMDFVSSDKTITANNSKIEESTGSVVAGANVANLEVTENGSISETLYLNITSNAVIYNYGSINSVVYTGTGTLTIYNMKQDANIGSISADSATSVNIYHNRGTIGDVSCKGTITIGSINMAAPKLCKVGVDSSNQLTIDVGNGEQSALSTYSDAPSIGNLTAGGAITVYRNIGTIGDITSKAAVTIGQNNTTYDDYQINSGKIGNIDAVGVYIYNNTETGKIAAEEGETVTSASDITIGTSTTVSGVLEPLYINLGEIGDIVSTAPSTQTTNIYSSGKIGDITKNVGTGAVNIFANSGMIGAIENSYGPVTVGLQSKSAATAGNVLSGNGSESSRIESILSGAATTVYRNLGTIGDIKSATSVTIGQKEDAYKDYQINSGTIGSIDAATSITVNSNTADGQIAQGDKTLNAGTSAYLYVNSGDIAKDSTITAGSAIIVGTTTDPNHGNIGKLISNSVSSDQITVYSDGTIESITKENGTGNLSIVSNGGTIGPVKNAGSVYVGSERKNADAGTLSYGNLSSGRISSIDAGLSVNIYRNLGEIGDVNTNTSILIGQKEDAYKAYQINSGKIGKLTCVKDLSVYNNTETGEIAKDSTITAGTAIIVGTATTPILGSIGKLISNSVSTSTGTDTINIYSSGSIAGITNENGLGNLTIFSNGGAIGPVKHAGNVYVGASDKTADAGSLSFGNCFESSKISSIDAGLSVNIYRNLGEIGDVNANTSILIGQNSEACKNYNINSGSIGGLTAGTSASVYTCADGTIDYLTAGTTANVGSSAVPNGNTIGNITSGGNLSLTNAGTVGKLTAKDAGAITLTLLDGSNSIIASSGTGGITVTNNQTEGNASVDVTTGGSIKNVAGENGYAIVNAVSTVPAGKSVDVSGDLNTLIIAGNGTVYSTTANNKINTIAITDSGKFLVRGDIGNQVEDVEQEYFISLVPDGGNSADIYLVSSDILPAGTAAITFTPDDITVTGAVLGDNGYEFNVVGGTLSEKLGSVALNRICSVEITASGTFCESDIFGKLTITVPELVDRVDTLFIPDEEAFENAKSTYGWGEEVSAPGTYPAVAVLPTLHKAYDSVSVRLGDEVFDEVLLKSIDTTGLKAGDAVELGTLVAEKNGYPSYTSLITYTLTEADIAALDEENTYHTVIFDFKAVGVAAENKPVKDGETVIIPTAPERKGYTFLYWELNGKMYNPGQIYMPESDVTFEAKWGAESVLRTLTISTNGGPVKYVQPDGSLADISGTMQFLDGTEITLKAVNMGRYSFKKWSVSGAEALEAENQITFTISSDVIIRAYFFRATSSSDSAADSSSGSSASQGNAIFVSPVKNGEVTVNPTSAKAGDTITVTVKNDEGYELQSLSVKDKNGSEIKLTDKGNGKYTFVMPDSNPTILASFTEKDSGLPFLDVEKGAYYYDAVAWAVENGITSGTTATTFSPDTSCTRAQMVTFLWRALGSPAPKSSESIFTDIESGSYCYDAVLWAVENGITNGKSDSTFAPDDTCTRAQAVTFLCRAIGVPNVSAVGSFADVNTDSYYADAVNWAVEQEITNGTGDNTFSPDAECTRAQIVTFLYRALVK